MVKTKNVTLKKIKQQKALIIIAIPVFLYVLLFNYVPIWGWVLAFNQYQPGSGFLETPWVGFQNFIDLFNDERFYQVIINTLGMSALNLIFGTIACVGLAILLSEIRFIAFKKLVQTVSYLPFFISWVAAASIVITFLSNEGPLNDVLKNLHLIDQPILFLGKPELFWTIITLSAIWKSTGYGAIVYLSAITSIDPSLYEAANIDGAGRLKRIWHITLPGIMPTIIVLLILHIGGILNTGFEQQYLLGNNIVGQVSEVLDLYVLRYGIQLGNYSYSVAAGMFKSVISIILIVSANTLAKRMNYSRLY